MHGEPARSDHSRPGVQAGGGFACFASRSQAGTRRSRMKLEGLLRHLRRQGCVLRREGKEHAIWETPQTGHAEAVPRHSEISNHIYLPGGVAPGMSSNARSLLELWT